MLTGLDPTVVDYDRWPGLTAEKLEAGVRMDTEEFRLFEKLINSVHEHAPGARICFNTGPTDSVGAVRCWT